MSDPFKLEDLLTNDVEISKWVNTYYIILFNFILFLRFWSISK
jgi:hypothetical protein